MYIHTYIYIYIYLARHPHDLPDSKNQQKSSTKRCVLNVCFVCCFVISLLFLRPCGGELTRSEGKKQKQKQQKNNKLNHVWARPVPAEAADLFKNIWFVVFVFVFLVFSLFLSPCDGTLTRSEEK